MTTTIQDKINKRLQLRIGTEWFDQLSRDYLTLDKVEGDVMHLSNDLTRDHFDNIGYDSKIVKVEKLQSDIEDINSS